MNLLLDDIDELVKNRVKIDFDMNFDNIVVSMKDLKKYGFVNVFISKTVLPFYLVCIAITLVIYLL